MVLYNNTVYIYIYMYYDTYYYMYNTLPRATISGGGRARGTPPAGGGGGDPSGGCPHMHMHMIYNIVLLPT